MATPSSPKLTISLPTNDPVSLTKKPQPIPWTHQETVNLIRAYQEKWYSLKRGPLRSNQWEEVAVVVAARCGYDFNHPSKSALQCRHKMEKLRQRHRAEKHRPTATSRAWQYLNLMDELQHGPMPIPARPLASFGYNNDNDDEEDDEHEYDHDDYDDNDDNYIKSRSINYILNQRSTSTKYIGFSREHVGDDDNDNDNDADDDDDDDDDEEGVMVNEKGLVSGLTEEMRVFADRFVGLENLKMEMMKETQRFRLEMEKKRIQMILESQRKVVDSIGRAFGSSSKRMKIGHPI